MTITIYGNRINSKDIKACYVRKYEGKYYLTLSISSWHDDCKEGFKGEFGVCSFKNESDAINAHSALSELIDDSLLKKRSYTVVDFPNRCKFSD